MVCRGGEVVGRLVLRRRVYWSDVGWNFWLGLAGMDWEGGAWKVVGEEFGWLTFGLVIFGESFLDRGVL